MTVIKAVYGCAQKDLFSGLRIVWKSYLTNVANFTAKKGKYTVLYATNALAAIDAAEELPDDESRIAAAETLRLDVEKAAALVVDDFVSTEGYIDDLFPIVGKQKPQYVLAGYNFFEGAEKEDWESVTQLGTKNSSYVSTNTVALEMGGMNMPVGFPASVAANFLDYETKLGLYMTARQTAVETGDKITACNGCYKTGAGMMKDAVKLVYRNKPISGDAYNWDRVQAMINPTEAGMDGYLTDVFTSVALVGAAVVMKMDGNPAITTKSDISGKYVIKGITAGTYVYTITMVGYTTITGTIEIKVRNISRMNFEMEAVGK